ncbi:MAG: formylmethanofuran dehydrogenase subunit E family protein [Deltaproteobacteria bacterium]|nr:formylmethanofuran dehydrogenase subunit E family protein [Deltaproteobacteria bacterium]
MQKLDKIDSVLSEMIVCGRSLDVFFNDIERFHGFIAPGLVLGGFMVDWARELVGLNVESDAIVETCHCLPDAVQIFTPCTIGNGWLKVLDWDKFALTLYDKKKLTGYRVWFDLKKAALFPNVYNWYMRKIPKKDLPLGVLLEGILNARRSVFSCRPVRVTGHYGKKRKGKINVCSGCGEAYPASQGSRCTACRGEGYYSF